MQTTYTIYCHYPIVGCILQCPLEVSAFKPYKIKEQYAGALFQNSSLLFHAETKMVVRERRAAFVMCLKISSCKIELKFMGHICIFAAKLL